MEAIKIDPTDETPSVILDKAQGIFQLGGRSLPEDVSEFFQPVIDWISAYGKDPNPKTEFVFKMDYFNTASSKMLLDILLELEDIQSNGSEVTVKWHYREDDEDMEEAGEEYAEIIEVAFEQIPY